MRLCAAPRLPRPTGGRVAPLGRGVPHRAGEPPGPGLWGEDCPPPRFFPFFCKISSPGFAFLGNLENPLDSRLRRGYLTPAPPERVHQGSAGPRRGGCITGWIAMREAPACEKVDRRATFSRVIRLQRLAERSALEAWAVKGPPVQTASVPASAPDEGLTPPKPERVARRSHSRGITGSQGGPLFKRISRPAKGGALEIGPFSFLNP
jgi:hypothetical protein